MLQIDHQKEALELIGRETAGYQGLIGFLAKAGGPSYPQGIDPLTLKKVRAGIDNPHPNGLSAEEVGQ